MSMYSGGPVDYQSMQRQDDEAEDNQVRLHMTWYVSHFDHLEHYCQHPCEVEYTVYN